MSRSLCNQCADVRGVAEYENGTYCFACGHKEFTTSLVHYEKNVFNSLQIPEDKEEKIPQPALDYLHQYYFTNSTIKKHQIYWSSEVQRLIFPNQDGKCAWSRSLTDKNKWLKYGNKSATFYARQYPSTDTLILVEDQISCLRLSEFCDTLALCGTSVKENMQQIILDHPKIILWLDGDEAGIRGAEKIYNHYKMFKDIRIIKTNQDPKCFNRIQIEELLNGK